MTIVEQKKNEKRVRGRRAVRQSRSKACSLRPGPAATGALVAALSLLLALAACAQTTATEAPGSIDRTAVGFVTGHGEPGLDGALSGVSEALLRTFSVSEVDLSEGALDDLDVVVVAGGPDIPDAELYELDQFLMRGGRIAFLLDAASIPREGTQARLSPGNIFGYLATYGIIVNPDLVLDRSCADGAVWGDIEAPGPYPYWPVVQAPGILGTHPAVSGLTSVPLAWTSSISMRGVGTGTRKSVLLRSSPDSWTVSALADLGPDGPFEPPTELDDVHRIAGFEGFPLAVAVEGAFGSAFAGKQVIVESGRKVEFVDPVGMIEESVPTRVIVFGSSMVFTDDVAGQLPGGADLLADAISWLASDEVVAARYSDSVPEQEWTPRRTALVALILLCAASALAALAVRVSRHRRR